jgi:hypothetical protein
MPFTKVIRVYFGNHMEHASTLYVKNMIAFGELHQVAPQLPLVFKWLKLPSPSIHKHKIQAPMKGSL